MATQELEIRAASDNDGMAIWAILEPIFRAGETYAIETDISQRAAVSYWMKYQCFVAEQAGEILGTYYIRPNQRGGGAHVCNCGYATAPAAQGRGVARAMLEHSLVQAKTLGFKAMQFNFVLANNVRAIDIWKRAGFKEIGRIPEAFDHPKQGLVDAVIMHKALTDS